MKKNNVGARLSNGLMKVKENQEIIDLEQQIVDLKRQIELQNIQGSGSSSEENDVEMAKLTANLAEQSGVYSIPIELIDRDENQPRTVFPYDTIQERVESLRRYEQQTPIILIPQENERYKLFDGELRYRAAKKLNWETLNAVFLNAEDYCEDHHLFESQVITSIHSKRLHDLDLAFALLRLIADRYPNIDEAQDRLPKILSSSLRRLERTQALSELSDMRLAPPEDQSEWLEGIDFKELEERQLFKILLELQLNPRSVSRHVFPLLRLSDDLISSIQNSGLEGGKAREINKLSASKLELVESEALDIRSEVIERVVQGNLSLTETKTLVRETIAEYSDVEVPDANPAYFKSIEKLDVNQQDTELLTKLKKLLNSKLKEINSELKERKNS